MNTRYASRNSGRSRVSVLSHLMQAWKVTAPSTRGFAAAAFVAILGKHSLAGAGRASLLLLVGSLFLAGTVPSAQAEQPSVVSPVAAPALSLDGCLRESLTANPGWTPQQHIDAAREGLGMALVSALLGRRWRDEGALAAMTEQTVRGPNWAWLVHRDSQDDPLARAFCGWLCEALGVPEAPVSGG